MELTLLTAGNVTAIGFIAYVLIHGLANHIRGGYFQKFYYNTGLWKVFAAVMIAVASYFCLPLTYLGAAGLAVVWYLFMLPQWGGWFDIGTIAPDYKRGGPLRGLYIWLGSKFSQRFTDIVMMIIRGLDSVIIFGFLAFVLGNWWILCLVPIASVIWTMGYVFDRVFINKNYSEYLAGAAIGAMIAFAFLA